MHGGIQAVLLDETCCVAAFFSTGRFVMTGELNVRYRRPCPIDRPLMIAARIESDEGRFLRVGGEIRILGESELITVAEGKFYPNPTRQSQDGMWEPT